MLTWAQIQDLYTSELAAHRQRSEAVGLKCPLDVFEQLFHDHHGDADFALIMRVINWRAVQWDDTELSGVALRRISIPRPYRLAVDEARTRTMEEGISDERPEVIEHWESVGTWMRSPVLVAGEVTGTSLDAQCLVGFTRLGNLLGLLDRQDIPEAARHRVWLGRRILTPSSTAA